MPASTPKKLSAAPLSYVLVQVRFTPILTVHEKIPELQDKLRKKYPKFEHGVLQSIRIGPGENLTKGEDVHRWEFLIPNRTTGVTVTRNSLVLHTTAYSTFEEFLEEFRNVLAIAKNSLDIDYIERIGLRYVDLIQTRDKDNISDYVVRGLHGFPINDLGLTLIGSQIETVADSNIGRVIFRLTRTINEEPLPRDLLPIQLAIKRKPPSDSESAFLDFDHFCEYRDEPIEFSMDKVVDTVGELHNVTSAAFRNSVTPSALKTWA